MSQARGSPSQKRPDRGLVELQGKIARQLERSQRTPRATDLELGQTSRGREHELDDLRAESRDHHTRLARYKAGRQQP